MMRKLLLLAAPLCLMATPSARGTTFVWTLEQRNIHNPVEQQAPVTNPTGCAWDPDDKLEVRGAGDLAAGESTEWHECLIADWLDHQFTVVVIAPSPNLRVEIGWANPDGARSLTAPGVPGQGKTVRYETCFAGPEYNQGSPLLQPIPDSNGGVGQVTDLYLRITNTGTRSVRDITVSSRVNIPSGCATVREYIVPAELWWWHP
jgi:hypothetical protein